jgi:tetratricopeptide (TPR) repeat protein
MIRFLVVLLLGVLGARHCLAASVVFPGPAGKYGVGLHVLQLFDRSRNFSARTDLITGAATPGERARPVQALVWYPAEKSTRASLQYQDYLRLVATEERFDRNGAEITRALQAYLVENYPVLDGQALVQPMLARRDAPPAAGKFPVVVYAPGASGVASDNADLCEYLASHGYLVIASASVGRHTRSMSVDLDGVETQARDTAFLIGHATTLPNADGAHIAAMGYSLGGLANMLAAAQDDRITALVSLDGSVRYFPAIVQQATYAVPERLALPMLYLGSKPKTAEAMNRSKQVPTFSLMNAMKYADLYNVTMYFMEHAAFESEALRLAPEQRFGEYTRQEATVAHGWMGRYVRAFLDAHLRGDAAASAFMRGTPKENGVPPRLLAVDVRRADGAPPTLTTLAGRFAGGGHRDIAGVYAAMQARDAAFKPDERSLIAWGEQFLKLDRPREAVEIFALATTLYPDSGRAVYYLATAYDKHHDTALSIAAYQRVLGFWTDLAEAKQHILRLQATLNAPARP